MNVFADRFSGLPEERGVMTMQVLEACEILVDSGALLQLIFYFRFKVNVVLKKEIGQAAGQ